VDHEQASIATEPTGEVPIVDVMGLPLWALDRAGLIRLLVDRSAAGVASRVYYVNAHIWNLARRNASFHRLLTTADVLYADGMSLVWASRLLGQPLPDRLSSADYVEDFARACATRGVSLYLLGGTDEVARQAADRLTSRVADLRIVGTQGGYFDMTDGSDVIDQINRAQPDLLLVGMGSPRQERWSARNQSRLEVPVIWSVGALFDYLADAEWRAPQWMCRCGLEWAFRLAADPFGKAGRYLVGNPVFVGSVVKARLLQSVRGDRGQPAEVKIG